MKGSPDLGQADECFYTTGITNILCANSLVLQLAI